jgi:uncharacterized glyoxalase superfamily protein PhnB
MAKDKGKKADEADMADKGDQAKKGKKAADKGAKKDKKAAKKQDKAARKAEKKAKNSGKGGKGGKGSKSLGFRSVTPSVTSNDIAVSLKFYENLGFKVKETWKGPDGDVRGYELAAGKTPLMIGQDDFAKGKDRKKGEGVRLYLQTKESVDDVAARLKAAGVTLESEPADQSWGGRTFSVADPDGFKITIASSW